MLAEAEETGVIEEAEEEMLYKVFDFAEKEVHDVMVPRPEVVGVSVELPAEECLAAIIDSPFTRYPAYRGSLDEIVGILHVRDLFSALYANGIENVVIEDILRPAHFVPETKDLGPLLTEFRRANQHMAIVVDEYGSTQGIVTLEDLLEEIVGEIEDEYDMPDDSVQRIDEQTVRVDGTFPIDDFNEQFARTCLRRTTTRSPASCSASSGGRRRPATRSPGTACASRSSRPTGRASSSSRSSFSPEPATSSRRRTRSEHEPRQPARCARAGPLSGETTRSSREHARFQRVALIVQKYGGTSVGDPERITARRRARRRDGRGRATRSASSSRRWATRPTS